MTIQIYVGSLVGDISICLQVHTEKNVRSEKKKKIDKTFQWRILISLHRAKYSSLLIRRPFQITWTRCQQRMIPS